MEQEEGMEQNILQTAVSLFAQKGYDGIGVQEICDAAKVTKPTLYYYFGSKAGLLKKIADTKGDELVVLLMKSTNYIHDFSYSLAGIYKNVIDFALQNPDFFRLHCVLLNSPSESEAAGIYKEVKGAVKVLFDDFFSNSCNELGNMRGKEKLYSTLFQNNVNSVALSVLQKQISCDEGTIYQIVHSFVYGVAA